jgi:hypothetical protein
MAWFGRLRHTSLVFMCVHNLFCTTFSMKEARYLAGFLLYGSVVTILTKLRRDNLSAHTPKFQIRHACSHRDRFPAMF